jgi:hypothetical protein
MELAPFKKEPLVFEGEESAIKLKELTYEGTVGMPLIIPVKAEKGSFLIMKIYQDSALVSTDSIEMDKKRMDLEITPLPGTSVVELEITDSEGNIHRNNLNVSGKEPVKFYKDPGQTKPEVAEAPIATAAVPAAVPAAILLSKLQQDELCPLHGTLMETDLEKEGIDSPRLLFEHLYLQADQGDYSKEDVDLMLAETIAGKDAVLLLKQLKENSEGPLNVYLAGLDLEKEGINTNEELLRQMEEAAVANSFTMEDVRSAMIRAMDHPLEAEQRYEELLEQYEALTEKGFSNKEIASMLEEMFPGHGELISELTGKGSGGGFLIILGVGLGSIILLFILFFVRRRKREE